MFFGATAFAEAPFSSEGIINQSVDVTGLQLQANVSTVAISVGVDVNLTTNLIQSNVSSVTIIGEANVNLSTNLIQTALGNEVVTTDEESDTQTLALSSRCVPCPAFVDDWYTLKVK